MNKKFRIELCSDLDYEEMITDICYGDHTFATVTQEKGPDNMEIEIYIPKGDITTWNFHLDDLINILQTTKKKLMEFKKLDD